MEKIEDNLRKSTFVPLDMKTFTGCRDYVILRILFSNGQRSGTILRITNKVIQNRQRTENGGVTLCVGILLLYSRKLKDFYLSNVFSFALRQQAYDGLCCPCHTSPQLKSMALCTTTPKDGKTPAWLCL